MKYNTTSASSEEDVVVKFSTEVVIGVVALVSDVEGTPVDVSMKKIFSIC